MEQNGSYSTSRALPPRPLSPVLVHTTSPRVPPRPSEISLTAPRPGMERRQNEYIETPFLSSSKPPAAPPPNKRTSSSKTSEMSSTGTTLQKCSHPKRSGTSSRSGSGSAVAPIITSQPHALTFKKESVVSPSSQDIITEHPRDSIICSQCGRCKCEACRRPRPLPKKWLCHNCLCSAESIVDYSSCLCCVKASFYHFTKDYDGDSAGPACADKPCSCAPNHRCLRWGCMGALSVILPCLWCYWPLRGCVKTCELGYQRYHSRGCRCRSTTSDLTPEKRLLDTSNSDC